MADLEPYLAQVEDLAVRQVVDRELGLGAGAERDGGAGGIGQLQVPGQEVGVEVRLDDPLDGQPVGGGVGEVLADVALGVDDDRSAFYVYLRYRDAGARAWSRSVHFLEGFNRTAPEVHLELQGYVPLAVHTLDRLGSEATRIVGATVLSALLHTPAATSSSKIHF